MYIRKYKDTDLRERERERERARDTERDRERQTERQTERDRERHREPQREREGEREIYLHYLDSINIYIYISLYQKSRFLPGW